MPDTKKSTDIIKKQSAAPEVQQIIDWILAGHSMFDVDEAISQKITKSPKKKAALFAAVMEYFEASGQANPDIIKGWALESLREIYRKMIAADDFENARKAIKDIILLSK